MNKPAYAAIQTHSPTKPVLIFVASRRQTRLTALDIITYAAADGKPRTFLNMDDQEMDLLLNDVQDSSLRHTLGFGVGIHHAGLCEKDRTLVERLYVGGQIQLLVATSTLAWGINSPTFMVIVKGTEFFDAASMRYVQYSITDVLQMMGRAGRPQYDDHGVAVVMVHEPMKSFYKKFLYEPFPVESSLHKQLDDHLNAEIAMGTITSMQDAVDWLTYTFFLRRLLQNPAYYGLDGTDPETVSSFLSTLIGDAVNRLAEAQCVEVDTVDDEGAEGGDAEIRSTFFGRISSTFYLRYETMKVFASGLTASMDVIDVIRVLCGAAEYSDLPVRHNEDVLNAQLIPQLRYPMPIHHADKAACKAEILIQAHLDRLQLPVSDYVTDTRTVLDSTTRILQAMIEVIVERGWWQSCYAVMRTVQCLMQATWGGKGRQKNASKVPKIVFSATFNRSATKTAIELTAISKNVKSTGGNRPRKAFAPCFPKIRDEGWWCAIVDDKTDTIISLRRFAVVGAKTSVKLPLDTGEALARLLHEGRAPNVHIVSDSYVGVDIVVEPEVCEA